MANHDLIGHYRQNYWAMLPTGSLIRDELYVADQFGDIAALADELGNLIVRGTKTATCSALWEWEAENPLPAIGLHTIVLDGQNAPLCIIKITDVIIQPSNAVDALFAWQEGEGDRTLQIWRDEHWHYFTRTFANIGKAPTPDMPLMCERFRVIYPT